MDLGSIAWPGVMSTPHDLAVSSLLVLRTVSWHCGILHKFLLVKGMFISIHLGPFTHQNPGSIP